MLLFNLFLIILYSSLYKSYDLNLNKSINRIGILILIYILYMLVDIMSINKYINNIYIYNDIFNINILSQYISIIIIGITILLLFNSITTRGNIELSNVNYKYISFIFLLMFNILGLILLMYSNNLILLYVTIELQSYCLYILCGLYHNSNNSLRSSLIYFLYGGLGSILVLFGSALLYYSSGSLNILYICLLTDYNNYINLSYILILIGLTLKMGLSPLHNWSIFVYSNVPTIITSWISIVAKISILTFLFNIFYLINNDDYLNYILVFVIALSLIIGSINGLSQTKIKTYLAYSGILNASYLLFMILIHNLDSLVAYIIYITQYSLTHVNLFLIILFLPIFFNNDKNSTTIKNIFTSIFTPVEFLIQIKWLLNYNPYLNLSLIISLFSLIGLPPLFGFYGKLLIIMSGLSQGYYYLTILLIVCSVISTVYYLYLINISSIIPVKDNIDVYINNNNNNTIFNGSITYIISSITLILALNWIQIDNIIKGAYILGIYYI